MQALQPRYSEVDVLLCLEQSANLLDHILTRGQQGFGALPRDEQNAISQELATIFRVLAGLRWQVIPSMLADRSARNLLRRQDVAQSLWSALPPWRPAWSCAWRCRRRH